jgi:hypothetical protein
VTAEKRGKQIFYSVRSKKVLKLLSLSDAYIKDILESVLFCEVVSEEKGSKRKKGKLKSA